MARQVKDYLKLLQSLLPPGKVWSRSFSSVIGEFLYGEANELARIDNRAQDILIERNTKTTNELLTDHELEWGLPDECTRDLSLTLEERRLAVYNKKVSLGGQNKEYFIQIAANLGYIATITEYTPFWCGLGVSGSPCGPQENIFYWTLTIYSNEDPIIFKSGTGASGDPLQKISSLLEAPFCLAEKWKPAHTILLTALAGPGFSSGFDSGFDSLSNESDAYLTGGFSQGFDLGFDVAFGGGYDQGFDVGFEKSA